MTIIVLGNDSTPNLKDVLVFLTACDTIPPIGYSDLTPTIDFRDDIALPKVSTCALTFSIPINFPIEHQQFKEKMDLAILGSQGFFGNI